MRRRRMSQLKWLSEEDQLDWAGYVLCELTDKHAKALDLQGWKIVRKEEPDCLWPFSSKSCDCPLWCEDISRPLGLKN